MALTNFAALTSEQLTAWGMEVMKTARQNSFLMSLMGTGMNAPIERITELTKSDKGTRAVITLVPDLESDGIMGDSVLEGNEESAKAYDQVIRVDQIRNANRSAGRMADQKSVVRFRETSRDLLGFWLADRIDQLGFLTAAGMDYRLNTNGSIRSGFSHNGTAWARTAASGAALYDLEYAADVTAPTSQRYFQWDASNGLSAGDITAVSAADTPSYAMLVELKAHAKDRRIKSLRAGSGEELFHVFMHPKAVAKLKQDADFLANLRNAGPRGNGNTLFSGSMVTVDGLVIHENTHVPNTLGATAGTSTNVGDPGYKWGANADVDGSAILLMGAQALAYADIGIPEWDERDHFDYGAQPGIAIAKISGFKKPVFYSPKDGSSQDFGVIRVDCAI